MARTFNNIYLGIFGLILAFIGAEIGVRLGLNGWFLLLSIGIMLLGFYLFGLGFIPPKAVKKRKRSKGKRRKKKK